MKSLTRIVLGIACIAMSIGLVLMIIATVVGGKRAFKNSDFSYELEDIIREEITSIDLNVNYGTVEIVTGDEFKVSIYNMPEDGYKSYVKQGTWIIEDTWDSDNMIQIFGLKIPIQSIGIGFSDFNRFNDVTNIVITVPEDFHADEIDLDIAAGKLNAEKLSGNKIDLEVGAGKMEVDKLIADNFVDITCGAGELIVYDIQAPDAKVECGVGNIEISGRIAYNCDVENGVGSVTLDIEGNEEDYNYSVDCGIGNVIINNRSYGFTTDKTIRNSNAIGNFNLECGIGQIKLSIR